MPLFVCGCHCDRERRFQDNEQEKNEKVFVILMLISLIVSLSGRFRDEVENLFVLTRSWFCYCFRCLQDWGIAANMSNKK